MSTRPEIQYLILADDTEVRVNSIEEAAKEVRGYDDIEAVLLIERNAYGDPVFTDARDTVADQMFTDIWGKHEDDYPEFVKDYSTDYAKAFPVGEAA